MTHSRDNQEEIKTQLTLGWGFREISWNFVNLLHSSDVSTSSYELHWHYSWFYLSPLLSIFKVNLDFFLLVISCPVLSCEQSWSSTFGKKKKSIILWRKESFLHLALISRGSTVESTNTQPMEEDGIKTTQLVPVKSYFILHVKKKMWSCEVMSIMYLTFIPSSWTKLLRPLEFLNDGEREVSFVTHNKSLSATPELMLIEWCLEDAAWLQGEWTVIWEG